MKVKDVIVFCQPILAKHSVPIIEESTCDSSTLYPMCDQGRLRCDCASRAFGIGTRSLFKTLVHQSDDVTFSFCLNHHNLVCRPGHPNETPCYQASQLGLYCLLHIYVTFEQLMNRCIGKTLCLRVSKE